MGCNGPTATETRDDDPTLLMGCGKATGTTGGMGFGPASGSFARHQAMPLASQMAVVALVGPPLRVPPTPHRHGRHWRADRLRTLQWVGANRELVIGHVHLAGSP